MSERLILERNLERTAQDLTGLAKAVDEFRKKPAVEGVAGFHNGVTRFVFDSLNGKLEDQFRMAMLGKALRDSPLMASDPEAQQRGVA